MKLSKKYILITIVYILIVINIYGQFVVLNHLILLALPVLTICLLVRDLIIKSKQLQDVKSRQEELKEIVERHQYLAYYDMTTGLANRVKMNSYFNNWIETNDNQRMAVLFMDIDKFKSINDNNGHKFGDIFLRKYAERLEGYIKGHGELYRYAGDEFVALIPYDNFEKVESIIDRFLVECRMPFDIVDKQINVTSSVGISLFPEHSNDINELIDYADMAMYHGKSLGRDKSVLYDMNKI